MTEKSEFAGRHIGPRAAETRAMLASLGVPSLETLISQTVPNRIRLARPLDLPAPATEAEALAELAEKMSANKVLKSFVGLGYHGTHVPPVILRNMFENPAWYTAYTPYQAEISQGRLEMLFNFQTLVTELTGLPVASASLLDEATALAEAVGIAFRHHREKRTRIAFANKPHPQTRDVVETRAEPLGIEVDGDDDRRQYRGAGRCLAGHLRRLWRPCGQDRRSQGRRRGRHLRRRSAGADHHADAGQPRRRHRRRLDAALRRADRLRRTARRLLRGLGQADAADARPACRPVGRQPRAGPATGSRCRRASSISAATRRPPTSAPRRRCSPIWRRPMPSGTGRKACRRSPAHVHELAARLAAALKAKGVKVLGRAALRYRHGRGKGRARRRKPRRRRRTAACCAWSMPICVGISFDETSTEADLQAIAALFGATVPAEGKRRTARQAARMKGFLSQPVFHENRSETEMMRFLRKLADKDLALDRTMIPLGSCTMKLNAAAEMIPVTWPSVANLHPFAPKAPVQGLQVDDATIWSVGWPRSPASMRSRCSRMPAARANMPVCWRSAAITRRAASRTAPSA